MQGNEAPIPNILLQEPYPIEVLLYYEDLDESYTIKRKTFTVIPRPQPEDYVYTETEVLNYETVLNIAQSVRDDADAGEFDGEPGAKGDTGAQGIQGIQGSSGNNRSRHSHNRCGRFKRNRSKCRHNICGNIQYDDPTRCNRLDRRKGQGFNYEGEWSVDGPPSADYYVPYDVVTHEGSTYICVNDPAGTGSTP